MPEEYEVIFTGHEEISFSPLTEREEILQNVLTIISTLKYSVPMFRGFGIKPDILDAPMNEATGRIMTEIIQSVREHEPRAEITRINFMNSPEDGKLNVRLGIKINEREG